MNLRCRILLFLILVSPLVSMAQPVDDAVTTAEDTQVTFSITDNDAGVDPATVDLDINTADVQSEFSNADGSWSVDASGNLTFIPTLNFNGEATLSYAIDDPDGNPAGTATITITVTPVNDEPVAVDDSGQTTGLSVVVVNVLENDTDVDSPLNPARIDLNQGLPGVQNEFITLQGIFTSDGTGNITFTPLLNVTGSASVNYTVEDVEGLKSNVATLTILMTYTNSPPVANNDTHTMDEDSGEAEILILANDTDDDGLVPASVDLAPSENGRQSMITNSTGTFSVDGSGVLRYTSAVNYHGTATIQYTVADTDDLVSDPATVTITVNSVNDVPVATNDVATTDEGAAVTVNILSNDLDVDGTLVPSTVDLDPTQGGVQKSKTVTGGVFEVSASGVVTFTPEAGYNGTATASYTVSDNEGGVSNVATITITISEVDAIPVAVDDTATTDEGVAVTINILANDTDDDGLNAAKVDLDPGQNGIQNSRTVTGGSFSINTSGVVTFTPNTGFSGTATTQYTVEDITGNTSNAATITVTVNSVNSPPVANADAASTTVGNAVVINVLENDTDADGSLDPASVDLNPTDGGRQTTATTAAGEWSVNASGAVTFTPATGFSGTATLSYTVNDNEGAVSNAAVISVTVNTVNAAPVAVNDAATTQEDTPVSVSILANDTDDGDINAATVDLDPNAAGRQTSITTAQGIFTVNNAGVLTFTPALNYNGTATVRYVVQDDEGLLSNEATVTITVEAVNDAPVAVNDAVTTAEDTPVTFNIITNDTDVDGTIDATTIDLNLTLAGIQNTITVTNGAFSVSSTGNVTFTPAANFYGSVSIQYTVRDNEGAVSNAATITVTVTPVNDPPVAVDDVASTDEGEAVTINILANDTDDGSIDNGTVDLDPSQSGRQTTRNEAGGTFVVNSSGVVTFSPAGSYNGTVVISYTVRDNLGLTSNVATITVTVNAVNSAPVAQGDAATTLEDTPVTINILANDTDDAGIDPSTIDLNIGSPGIQSTRTTPAGTFSVNGTGLLTFTPAENFNGTATISYTVGDYEGATSAPASIIITVTAVNDKPVAVNDSKTTNEDTSVVINVISNDYDVDGTVVASSVDLDPNTPGIQTSVTTTEGTFSVTSPGIVTFVPSNNFFGTATITYTIMDDQNLVSEPATITVTVTPVNDAPVANNDIASTNQGESVTLNVLTNDIDVDGTINAGTVDLDPSTAGRQVSMTTTAGVWSVDNSGNVTLVPAALFSGTASLSYTVADNLGAVSNIATISVLVNFVNQKPVANNDAATTAEDTPITFSVTNNDTDDGSINTSSVDLNPSVGGIQQTLTRTEGSFSVNGSGMLTYTPALNFFGSVSINYTVNDNIGETSNVATVTITVTPVNDAPLAVNDVASTSENVAVTINVLANDSDVDGTIDPTTVDLNPATEALDRTATTPQGTFTVSETTGIVTYTPAPNFTGTATRTYNVRDNNGLKSNNATITVSVADVNDPPTFNVIADQRVLRNSAAKTISITGISPGPGESEQLLITATSQNTTLLPHPTITYNGTATTATLSFKPQLNQTGTAEVVVRVVDSGLNEFSRTFVVTVVDVTIISTPITIAVPGEVYEYSITTTDIPETLALSASQKPAWLNITPNGKNAAILSGTPPANATASAVIIQLKDGSTVVDDQQFTIQINRRPVATPLGIELDEDTDVVLGPDVFGQAYSDPDGHPLASVKISTLPRHGQLLLGGADVAVDQVINIEVLHQLTYRPEAEYNGLDTVYYKVDDSYSVSLDQSYLHFVVRPVNDPPVITALESTPMYFDIGREIAQVISPGFNAVEPDGDLITGAVVGLRPPYFDPLHDVLEFTNTPEISGSYDAQTGILTLSGSATVEKYVEALRTVRYNYIDLDDIILDPRTVYFTLSDGVAVSIPRDRTISLTFEFVELDIPEVFTPDGNNKNDYWDITSTSGLSQYNDAVIRVFDKRGLLVHEVVGFDNPWDGRKNGRDLPEGSYLYTIDLKYGNIKYTGSVMILREVR